MCTDESNLCARMSPLPPLGGQWIERTECVESVVDKSVKTSGYLQFSINKKSKRSQSFQL